MTPIVNRRLKDVAQPPPAVSSMTLAKPNKGFSRRNLPHLQVEEKTYFVTFATYRRWSLPESVREVIIRHCLYDHQTKLQVHGVVVMPDHVPMVFTPLKDKSGCPFSLSEITNGIKGSSAHSINKLLKRKGHVWQDESFDHILRSEETIIEKVEYICQNPVRQGLVKQVDDYPWLWRERIEGERDTAGGGCATKR
ncbi:MAG: transposase [Deltaproteobacteria bacterium]|nr:transposase [Deltaproteobacteria bacterium]